jgi:hypothetical protein
MIRRRLNPWFVGACLACAFFWLAVYILVWAIVK